MALFPCDYCHERYAGAQQTIYPAVVHNSMSFREKRRACPICFAGRNEWIEEHLDLAQPDLNRAPQVCCWDGCEEDAVPYAVFATVYPLRSERVDYYGRACPTHAFGLVALALFGVEAPVPDP